MDTEDGKMEEDEVPNQGARGSHSRKPQSRSFSFNLDSLKSRKTNWSPDEESTLARLHRDVGNRWSMIAKHLPGRSDNDVKNMWHSTLRAKSCRRGSFLFTYVRAVSDCCDDHEARRAAYDKAKALCSGSHPASPLMASGPAGPAHRISAPGIASTGQSPQLSHRQQQLLQQQQQQTYQAASPGAASVEGPDSTGSLQSGPGSTGPGLQPGYPSGLLLHPQPQHQPPSSLGPHSNNSQGPSSSMQLRGPGPSSTGRTSLGAPSAFAGALDHGFGDASGALQLGRAPSGQPGGLLGNTAPPSPSPPPSRRSDFGSSELGGSVASEGSCLARLSSLHLAAGSGQGPAEIRTLGGMTLAGPAGLALPGLPLIGRHPIDRGRGRAGSRSWGPGAAGRSRGVSPRSAGARSMDVHGEDGMDLSLKELFKLPAGAEAGAAGVEAPQLATFGDNPLWHVGEQNQGQSDTHTEQQLQLQQMLLRGGAGAAGGDERSGHGAPRRQTRSMPQHPFFAGVEGSPQGGAGGSSLVLQPFGAEREQLGRQEEDAPAPFRPYVGQQLMGQQQQRLLRPPHMEGMPYVTLADAADPGEGPGDPGSLLDMDAVPGNAGRGLSSLQHVVRQRRGPASGSVSGPHRGRLVQFDEHMEGPASGLGLDPGPSSHGGHAAMTLHRFSGPGNEALRSGAMDHPLSLRANSEFREDGGPGGGMGGGGWLGHEGALGPGQLRVPSGVASRSSFSSAILEDWAAFAAHGGSGVPSEHVASFRGSETTGSSRLASGSSRHTAGKQKLMAELGYQSFASHGSFGGASGLGLASGASVSGASGSASGGGSGAGSFIAGYQGQGQVGAAQLGRSRFSPFYDDAMRLGPKLPGQSRSGPMMRVVDAEGGEQDTELPGPAPAPLSFGDMLPGQQQQHDEQLSLQQQQQQYQNHYQQQPTLHQQHHQYHQQQQQQQQHLGGSEGPLFAASAGNSGAMPSSSSHSLHRLDMQHLALALNSNSGRLPHSGGSAALSPGGLAVGAAPLASLAPGLLRPAPVVEGIVTMGLEDEDLYECLGELHEGRGGGGL